MGMERKFAEQLVESLSNHYGIIPVDKKNFIELLTSLNIRPTSKFYVELPDVHFAFLFDSIFVSANMSA